MNSFESLQPAEVEVPPVLAAQVSRRCDAAREAIKEAMGQTFGELMAYFGRQGLAPAGPPRAIYTAYGPEGVAFTVAFPIADPPAAAREDASVSVATIPGGKTLRFFHQGPYSELMTTYGRIMQYLQSKGLMQSEADWARYMPMWEEYLNDPQETPEADLRTYIYLPLP